MKPVIQGICFKYHTGVKHIPCSAGEPRSKRFFQYETDDPVNVPQYHEEPSTTPARQEPRPPGNMVLRKVFDDLFQNKVIR